jgi:AcrR family transcriptional regulator
MAMRGTSTRHGRVSAIEQSASRCSTTLEREVPTKTGPTKKKDRRIERTQHLIRGALIALIKEKGFEALTVQEIIDRANVGRATFYAHFDNKDDLLASGFEDLRTSLTARQREAFSRGRTLEDRVFGFSEEVFAHTNEYRDVFRVMAGKRSGAAVQRLLHKLLVDLIRDDVKGAVARRDNRAVPPEALVQFIAGALFGLLMWWMDGKTRLSIAEVNALFRTLAIPALKAAAR